MNLPEIPPLPWAVSAPVPVRVNGVAGLCANITDAEGRPVAIGLRYADAVFIVDAVEAYATPLEKETPKGDKT